MLKFFIFGDIGHDGESRSTVADAAAKLQTYWMQQSETLATFVLTTGDNIYGNADEAAFVRLQKEMMDKLPLPWFFCLGNHDVKKQKFEWHRSKDGIQGESGWSWHCPSPAYTVPEDITMNLIDLHVVNTNKLKNGIKQTDPPGPAADFYKSTSEKWWKEQKLSLQEKLQRGNKDNNLNRSNSKRWQVVVGHHPAEYVYLSLKEHGLWGIRYFPTTFMRGDIKSMYKRQGLAHVLRRDADLYLSGHQHLSAYMKLADHGKRRSKEEQRCLFAIVGNSSKLEQDDGDFDYDFEHGKEYQNEEKEVRKLIEKSGSWEDHDNSIFVDGAGNDISKNTASSTGFQRQNLSNIPKSRIRTLSESANVRYKKEWKQVHTFGFAVACVTKTEFTLSFIEVYKDGNFSESKTVKL